MRRLTFCLSIVLFFVAGPAPAAPTRVTFQLTGGMQWTGGMLPTYTPIGGPITAGRLVFTLSPTTCPTGGSQSGFPWMGGLNHICVRTLTFSTTAGQTFKRYAPIRMAGGPYGPGTHNASVSMDCLMGGWGTAPSASTTPDVYPAISGSNVAWYGWDGNERESYTTTQPLYSARVEDYAVERVIFCLPFPC